VTAQIYELQSKAILAAAKLRSFHKAAIQLP